MEDKIQNGKKTASRLDFQVIILVALFTLFAATISAMMYWHHSFQMMMTTYENRAMALYTSVESLVDPLSFQDINGPEDMGSALYQNTLNTLLTLKNSSGVMYLYTAKMNQEGNLVYVVDGLEAHLDFRYPNDPLEAEILPQMHAALNNVMVFPEDILHTDWGDIFVAYLPVHNPEGEVIGVVGIEFDASYTYDTLQNLQMFTIILAVCLLFLAGILCIRMFKRVSNPLYLDKNTKDLLTGLKNRNAYEVDMENLKARNKTENLGVVVADINGLKAVNDRLGHLSGDNYIKLVAEALKLHKEKDMVLYRTGGDEFVAILPNTTTDVLDKFVRKTAAQVKNQKEYKEMRCSVACGYAVYDPTQDENLEATYQRADTLMYQEKENQKDKQRR
ncbi:MAG: diguanylate cyclase [Eubacteriales bacterium]